MTTTPIPLTPPGCDLRDFAFMPLDVVRLRDSGLTAKATGDEFRAAVLLWCASWHQVPAASLPDDDDELANICGYSRSRREWAKVREGAMRGWEKCSDGRLYHSAVAAKALEAWIEKLASAIGGATGNAKRWGVAIETETMRVQFVAAVESLRAIDPRSRTLRKKAVAVLTAPSPPDIPGDSPPDSPPDSSGDRNRQGQGQGQGLEEKGAKAPLSLAAPPTPDAPSLDLLGDLPPSLPPCPVRQLVKLFVSRVPSLPRPRVELWVESAGADAMRQRWKWLLSPDATREDGTRYAETAAEAIEYFSTFFEEVEASNFLSGRDGNGKFDLTWLMKRENFMKVIQGNYNNNRSRRAYA